jgi:hypothetical protein
MCARRWSVVVAALCCVLFIPIRPAHANEDDGRGPDEAGDIATPPANPPADSRPASLVVPEELSTMAALAAGPVTEDFRYDKLKTEGKASEVCSGRLLPGSSWTFWEIVDQFGGTAGTMYACRERWDAANNPDCNGTVSNPSSSFFSTCWSNHAAGRAIDVMVGTVGGGYNSSRGRAIVNWLLAGDSYGYANANARRLGVQQILFGDRCWNSEGDRGIGSWNAMRECGIGHHDHVHIDLTFDGANGNVSYWGRTPRPPAPKFDTLAFWDFGASWREAVSWLNLWPTNEEGTSVVPADGYDRALVGDLDGDRVDSEVFLWDLNTGRYVVQEWNDGDSLNARVGQIAVGFDDVVGGDFDHDGSHDDMIFFDRDTGFWGFDSWAGFNRVRRNSGLMSLGYDDWVSGDFDGDGFVDDTLIWDKNNGFWKVNAWNGLTSVVRSQGFFDRRYDELIVGDWSAGGNLDETMLWDRNNGYYSLQSWSAFRPSFRTSGWWNVAIDDIAPGDYDTDGRIDDMFLYDGATGRWWIYSFHRFVSSQRRYGTWGVGFDELSVGSLNQ